MNPDTGHLVDLMSDNAKEFAKEKGYDPVPDELEPAAKRKLAGKDEAYVSRNSGGKLSKWGAKKRKSKLVAQKLKDKRKIARNSKKKNRR